MLVDCEENHVRKSPNYSPQQKVVTMCQTGAQESFSPGYRKHVNTFRSIKAHQRRYSGPVKSTLSFSVSLSRRNIIKLKLMPKLCH